MNSKMDNLRFCRFQSWQVKKFEGAVDVALGFVIIQSKCEWFHTTQQ